MKENEEGDAALRVEDCWAALAEHLAGQPSVDGLALRAALVACAGYACAEPGFTREERARNAAAANAVDLAALLGEREAEIRARRLPAPMPIFA